MESRTQTLLTAVELPTRRPFTYVAPNESVQNFSTKLVPLEYLAEELHQLLTIAARLQLVEDLIKPFVTHIGQGFGRQLSIRLPRRQSLIETKRLSGPAGSRRMRTLVTSTWPLSLFAHFEALNRRVPTPPQSDVDTLQHDVMDF
jgi:hypothetical protein